VAHPVQADVTDRGEIETMREAVHERFGPINVLVNNAGITCDRPFEKMTAEDWHRVIDVSLHGTFNCTRAFYDDVKTVDHGRVINIPSMIGKQGNVGQANYAAAKKRPVRLHPLALELAGTGTTANCIAPGFTHTEMVEAIPDEIQDDLRAEIPLE
jgi:3-oxoacyl-[acyl-carrier protein] reductase